MNVSRWTALGLMVLGYAIALSHGALEPAAWPAFVLLTVCAVAVQPRCPPTARRLGHGLFMLTGVALAAHWLPGFNSAPIMEKGQSSADAVPFITYLNLDKPLIGLWLLLACPWIVRNNRAAWQAATVSIALTITLCLGLAWALGVTAWAPKWPPYTLLWLANNLLLVTLTEELLFRGYLLGALQHYCHHPRLKGILPVGVSALLFGLAHLGGGWVWMLLASMAGVGYALAWRYAGLWAAVLAHFGLNLTHFCLFAYPMLKQ